MERKDLFMTEDEFEVLDELYFVESFDRLAGLTGKPAGLLTGILERLYEKGWIMIMSDRDTELKPEEVDLMNKAGSYFYLATKGGLLAHNS